MSIDVRIGVPHPLRRRLGTVCAILAMIVGCGDDEGSTIARTTSGKLSTRSS